MTEAEADQEVKRLIEAGSHGERYDVTVPCPWCQAPFFRAMPTAANPWPRANTCSDACQRAWNTRIMELDGGRNIVLASELAPSRLRAMLADVGIKTESGSACRACPS